MIILAGREESCRWLLRVRARDRSRDMPPSELLPEQIAGNFAFGNQAATPKWKRARAEVEATRRHGKTREASIRFNSFRLNDWGSFRGNVYIIMVLRTYRSITIAVVNIPTLPRRSNTPFAGRHTSHLLNTYWRSILFCKLILLPDQLAPTSVTHAPVHLGLSFYSTS
jgi:hypothetical protein